MSLPASIPSPSPMLVALPAPDGSTAIDAAKYLSRSGRYAAEVKGYASGPATDGSTYATYNATSAAGGYATDVAGSSPGTGYAQGMDQYMKDLA